MFNVNFTISCLAQGLLLLLTVVESNSTLCRLLSDCIKPVLGLLLPFHPLLLQRISPAVCQAVNKVSCHVRAAGSFSFSGSFWIRHSGPPNCLFFFSFFLLAASSHHVICGISSGLWCPLWWVRWAGDTLFWWEWLWLKMNSSPVPHFTLNRTLECFHILGFSYWRFD